MLDLGCGYGVVGILAGKLIGEENVIMCDVSEQAIECTNKNLNLNNVPNIRIRLSDGYKDIEETNFTLILSNPPYHADFSVPKHFIEVGFKKLILGGKCQKNCNVNSNDIISISKAENLRKRVCKIVVEQSVLQGDRCGKAARRVQGGAYLARGMSTRPEYNSNRSLFVYKLLIFGRP